MEREKQRKGNANENLRLPIGCAAAWDRPGHPTHPGCRRRERSQLLCGLSSPGTRILESRKQRGTSEGPTGAVLAHGAVLEREPARRGCGVFLRAAEGIRSSPDGRSKGTVSERHRVAARATRIFGLVAAPSRLRQRNDQHIGTSQAAFRREDFRCELDRWHCPCRTSRRFSSEEGSRG